jgi:antitoxin component YwqK of YwqJK toxin-antitoxin module
MKMVILNDNKKDGLVVEYYPLTNIISREHYLVDGEVKGRVKEFYSNGQIKRTYFVEDEGFSGTSQEWWENGNERSITHEDSDGINKRWWVGGNSI